VNKTEDKRKIPLSFLAGRFFPLLYSHLRMRGTRWFLNASVKNKYFPFKQIQVGSSKSRKNKKSADKPDKYINSKDNVTFEKQTVSS
jgi:hypothetical protein